MAKHAYIHIDSNKEVLFQNFDIVDILYFHVRRFSKVCTSLHKIPVPLTRSWMHCIYIDCIFQHFTTFTCRQFVGCVLVKVLGTEGSQSSRVFIEFLIFPMIDLLRNSKVYIHWNASPPKCCASFSDWSFKPLLIQSWKNTFLVTLIEVIFHAKLIESFVRSIWIFQSN